MVFLGAWHVTKEKGGGSEMLRGGGKGARYLCVLQECIVYCGRLGYLVVRYPCVPGVYCLIW